VRKCRPIVPARPDSIQATRHGQHKVSSTIKRRQDDRDQNIAKRRAQIAKSVQATVPQRLPQRQIQPRLGIWQPQRPA